MKEFSDFSKSRNKFQELRELGDFGTIIKVKEKIEVSYAVKKEKLEIPLTGNLSHDIQKNKVFREVAALANLPVHPNILRQYVAHWLEEMDQKELDEERNNLLERERLLAEKKEAEQVRYLAQFELNPFVPRQHWTR